MKLKQILKEATARAPLPAFQIFGPKEIEIGSIVANSKFVSPGSLFVARRGSSFDGNRFIPEAIESGAVAVLTDLHDPSLSITQIISPHVPSLEVSLAGAFWQWPSDELMMIGVTGTSGKTTTTYILRHLFSHLGVSSGLIGTISYIAGNHQCEATNTTPDVLTVHHLLREVVRSGSTACVMEVSSHALLQGRVDGIDFDTAIFTNLSHEHLDYHTTMEAYAEAKSMLFRQLGSGRKKDVVAVFNKQDPWAEKIVSATSARQISFAIDETADVMASNLRFSSTGTTFTLSFGGKSCAVSLPLAGRYNVANALAASVAFLARGISLEQIAAGLSTVISPPGRLERVNNQAGLAIYVDYAHKEDALRKALVTLRESTKGRLISVFGCGGDRDRAKRPKMARASEELADLTIVTTDNPRSEDPEAIAQEICSGFLQSTHRVVLDRKEAVAMAIAEARPEDVILIAGKGHEKYQTFAHGSVPFDDCEVAAECCASRCSTGGRT